MRPLCRLSVGLRPYPTADLPSGPACLGESMLTPLSGQSSAVSPSELLQRGGSLGRTVWAFLPSSHSLLSSQSKQELCGDEGGQSLRWIFEHLFLPISQPIPPSGPLFLVSPSCDFLSQVPFLPPHGYVRPLPKLLGWSDPI